MGNPESWQEIAKSQQQSQSIYDAMAQPMQKGILKMFVCDIEKQQTSAWAHLNASSTALNLVHTISKQQTTWQTMLQSCHSMGQLSACDITNKKKF